MSPAFSTREHERALLGKWFRFHEGKGHLRLELYVDGRATGIKTLVSRGNYDVSGFLQAKMAQQLRMPDSAYLRRFVECSIGAEEYVAMLRESGAL